MPEQESETPRLLTLQVRPRHREAVKPAELIQVSGHHGLTLNARRAITILWHNAHMQGVEENKDYSIEIDDLKPDGHKGYEMVEEAITALMQTLLTYRLPDGKTSRVQFLGGNDLDSEDRPAGVLTYSFDKRLIKVLQESTIWGKIALPVLMAFTSRYAVSLYENLAQHINLSRKTFYDYSLEDFRTLMGVPPGRYKTFGELNKHVIKPAVDEINLLAPFGIALLPVKQGKRVVTIKVNWHPKDSDQLRLAEAEMKRSKVGRRARMNGTTEFVADPMPSLSRMSRKLALTG